MRSFDDEFVVATSLLIDLNFFIGFNSFDVDKSLREKRIEYRWPQLQRKICDASTIDFGSSLIFNRTSSHWTNWSIVCWSLFWRNCSISLHNETRFAIRFLLNTDWLDEISLLWIISKGFDFEWRNEKWSEKQSSRDIFWEKFFFVYSKIKWVHSKISQYVRPLTR